MRVRAVGGGLVWAGVVVAAATGRTGLWLIEALFLLAPLVLVPLAIHLLGEPISRRPLPLLQPVAALAATLSFFVPRGAKAAALAGAWAALTVVLAWRGLERLRERGLRGPAELAIDAGLLFLPVGGGWLVLSRLGVGPLGFEEPIVLLTAVHFHFAGFTASVLVGHAGRRLGTSAPYRAIVAGTVAGPPLLALGITLSRVVEVLGAATLAGALWTFAFWLLRRLPSGPRGLARALLTVSALALLPSMAAALAYAWGQLSGRPLVALSWMARVHGSINALGFCLAGLVGWALAGVSPARSQPLSAVPVDMVRRGR